MHVTLIIASASSNCSSDELLCTLCSYDAIAAVNGLFVSPSIVMLCIDTSSPRFDLYSHSVVLKTKPYVTVRPRLRVLRATAEESDELSVPTDTEIDSSPVRKETIGDRLSKVFITIEALCRHGSVCCQPVTVAVPSSLNNLLRKRSTPVSTLTTGALQCPSNHLSPVLCVSRAGDEYIGSNWNILTALMLISIVTPLVGLVFAYMSYGSLWGLGAQAI